jgi:uncharacterized SAM-binding protein YcdF (DUF218 family)
LNLAARAVFDLFFSAGGVALLLLAGAVWSTRRRESAAPRRFLLCVALLYTALSIQTLGAAAGDLVAFGFRPFQREDAPTGRTAIVVLGSGSITARDWDDQRFSTVDQHAATRVAEAARVYRLTAADVIISSGGRVRTTDQAEPTGKTMRDALIVLGVPAPKILIETDSRNTHDEAVIVAPMLARAGVQHVILVTSRVHMRRSLGAFRAQGVQPVPAIARDIVVHRSWLTRWLPSDYGLDKSGEAAHEVLGILYYLARGWYRLA